ncbi:MAG: 4-(cytidine 5'-diphospho)-2-C-methyl-D-erythritol kinase [Thermodesulfovibrionales bacterium]
MKLLAPAKINWFLHVGKKRPDGYHEILSLMQFIDLFDEIELEPHEEIIIETDLDISVKENIAYKAAIKLRQESGYKDGVKIRIKKNIPPGAGLGGGSSDAAFTLIGLNKLWGLDLPTKELIHIGASIGSDIPFFLKGPSAIVKGRGDIVEKIEIKESCILLLIKPEFGISSTWAYNELDRIRKEKKASRKDEQRPISPEVFTCSSLKTAAELFSPDTHFFLRNDLEEPVLRSFPLLREIKNHLYRSGALYSAMTGSGSVIFGVFRSEEEALQIQDKFKKHWTKIVKTISSGKT